MMRSIVFMIIFFESCNLVSCNNNYDQAKSGYKFVCEYIKEEREYLGLFEKTADRWSKPIEKTWHTVQLPTYEESDGTLVSDKELWHRSIPCDYTFNGIKVCVVVSDILSGNINNDTQFPIQIKSKEQYIAPIMRDKVLCDPMRLSLIPLTEKLKKDAQAAYALLSFQQKIKHTFWGCNLANPYEK